MLSLLTFTIFNFLMQYLQGYYFLKRIQFVFKSGPGYEQSLFREAVETDTKNGPANPALNFWCSVSRQIKKLQWIKSRIWEKKEGKYSKALAKIQVKAVFLKCDIRITFLTQIYRDFHGDERHAGAYSFPQVARDFKKGSS